MKQKGGVVSRKGLYVLHQGEPVVTPKPPNINIKIVVSKIKPISPELSKAIQRQIAKQLGLAIPILLEMKRKDEKEKVIFT